MRITKRIIVWSYSAGLASFKCGAEHESDPDSFVVWAYFCLFGVAVGWSRDGWLYPKEATRDRALAVLGASPPPNVQTPAFLDEWDRLDALERGARLQ